MLFVLASMATTFAQTDIISTEDFKAKLKDKEVVIIDASKKKLYKKAHVKNALGIQYADLNIEGNDPNGLIQDANFIADYFGKIGINENTPVVVYDGGTQKYSSRMYFVLKYAGANNVSITHKDDKSWAKNRIMLTAAAPKARKATTFTANPQNDMMVDLDYVMANKDNDNVVLVDNRTAEEFVGEKKVVDGKFGHIPGAINIPYEEFETESGAFKSKAQLEELAAKYGLTNDKQIIFHCKTGVKGAVAYIAFKNILGHPNVTVYDGGCAEYCTKYDLVK